MVEYSTIEPWQMVDENGAVYDEGSLMAYFHDLLDPRHARGNRYSLVTLLILVFLAKLSGMDSPSAIRIGVRRVPRFLLNCCTFGIRRCPSITRSGGCLAK